MAANADQVRLPKDKFDYTCDNCGSSHLVLKGQFTWNFRTQQWVCEELYDDAWCNNCENDVQYSDRYYTYGEYRKRCIDVYDAEPKAMDAF